MLLSLHKDRSHRILLLFVCLCIVLLGIMIFAVPPGIDPDPCWGFLVMHGMEQGNQFNLLLIPDAGNIAKSHYAFLSWWSPGQYLFPYLLKTLFGVNTGHAVSLTIAICNLLGLAGFYQLFKQLGFTKWVAALSIAFIASQLFFIWPFVYYPGGEVLLFAFIGWFLYGCFSFKKITWQLLLFVFFAGLLGFFSKSSVLWMYIAGVVCIWINISINETTDPPYPPTATNSNFLNSPRFKKGIWHWLRNGMLLIVPFISALVIIYIFYLSRGDNPVSGQRQFLIRPETFSFPLASPILSGFSVDELFDGLIYQPDGPKVSYHMAIFILIVLAICSLVYMVFIIRLSPGKKYSLAILSFYVFGTVFFSYIYLKQSEVSYESRHFRIIGLLTIPGFIYLCFKTKITRVLFFMMWMVFIVIEFNFFKTEFNGNIKASRGSSGLSQRLYDAATVSEIIKIDHAHHNDAIFVVTSPDIATEINNNRVIMIDDENMSDQEFSNLKYAGTCGPIYILMPKGYVNNGKQSHIIKSFISYHNFTFKQLSPKYYLYYASN